MPSAQLRASQRKSAGCPRLSSASAVPAAATTACPSTPVLQTSVSRSALPPAVQLRALMRISPVLVPLERTVRPLPTAPSSRSCCSAAVYRLTAHTAFSCHTRAPTRPRHPPPTGTTSSSQLPRLAFAPYECDTEGVARTGAGLVWVDTAVSTAALGGLWCTLQPATLKADQNPRG